MARPNKVHGLLGNQTPDYTPGRTDDERQPATNIPNSILLFGLSWGPFAQDRFCLLLAQ